MIDLKSMKLSELTAWFTELSEPKFRAEQVFSWIHRGVTSFDEMTNLPKALREKLSACATLSCAECVKKQVSKDGTIKYLWKFSDGNAVESVLMQYQHGNTICISTQVGCRMGCSFCASTLNGLVRNLSAGEMLEQVIRAGCESKMTISNIVLMGMGEPLDNYDNVFRFLQVVNDAHGLGIGMRHISLSTCGLCDGILRLAEEQIPLTLSISLHAPDDKTRSAIMPINRKYNVSALMDACKTYYAKTGRRISFEYTMIQGVSDTREAAKRLGDLLAGFPCHINLIPLHRVAERTLEPSTLKAVRAFQESLEQRGLTVTVRRSLGTDIDAACGQLKRRTEEDMRGDFS